MGSGSAPKESYPLKKRTGRYLLAALVSAVTFAVYLPALRNDFVNWDDGIYVYENVHLGGLNGEFFRWAFTSFYASNWHPLTWISHGIDRALWGLDPRGHHLTNILLHAGNTFLAVILAAGLFDAGRQRAAGTAGSPFSVGRAGMIAAGVAGLLFGLHPLHVESVAWVSERKDLLCALFFLLSVGAYLSYASDKSSKAYIISLLLFLFALLSKSMAVTLPVVLLLLDWYTFRRIGSLRSFGAALAEKLPFAVFSLAASAAAVSSQIMPVSIGQRGVPLPVRLLVAARTLIGYLGEMALPAGLSPLYPYPELGGVTFFSLPYLFAVICVAGITVLSIVVARKSRLLAAAWGYYVVTLLPAIGLVQGGQFMADRYSYLPSLGPFLLAGAGAAWVWETGGSPGLWGKTVKPVSALAGICIVIALSYSTVKQIGVWKNSIVLWGHVIDREPGRVPFAYFNRGTALRAAGRLDAAMKDYNTAIMQDPFYAEARLNRGTEFGKSGQYDRAIEDFDAVIGVWPASAEAYMNRGIVLGEKGEYGRAVEDLDAAVSLNPGSFAACINRALVMEHMGRTDEAVADYTRAISLRPDYADAYAGRGGLYMKTGRKEEALRDFQEACRLESEEGCAALGAYGKR